MSWPTPERRSGLVWALLGVMALSCGGCGDTKEVNGAYFQVLNLDAVQAGDAGPVGLRLDLFQFGNEAGGLVRYFALEPARDIDGVTPFDSSAERACFWTNKITLDESQVRFTLTFQDDRNQLVRLTLDRSNDGVVLDGTRGLRESNFGENVTLPSLPVVLERDPEISANPNCLRPPLLIGGADGRPFEVELDFSTDFFAEVNKELEGSNDGQIRAGFIWVGSAKGESNEVPEWAAPLANFTLDSFGGNNITHQIYRGLPPLHLRALDPERLPYVRNDEDTHRMLLGLLVVYRDDEVAEPDENGDVPLEWRRDETNGEARLGSAFVSADGGATWRGNALLYTEIDEPGATPAENYTRDILNGFTPRAGYEVVEVTFRADTMEIVSIQPSVAEIAVQFVDPNDATYKVIEFILPRLPRPRRVAGEGQ